MGGETENWFTSLFSWIPQGIVNLSGRKLLFSFNCFLSFMLLYAIFPLVLCCLPYCCKPVTKTSQSKNLRPAGLDLPFQEQRNMLDIKTNKNKYPSRMASWQGNITPVWSTVKTALPKLSWFLPFLGPVIAIVLPIFNTCLSTFWWSLCFLGLH